LGGLPAPPNPPGPPGGHGPHPVHRAGQRELRPAQTLDEVAAPGLPGFLHGPQHRVDRGEAARDPFGGHGAPGQHAVTLEQRQRERVRSHGGIDVLT
jgi:hypothetical protein